MCTRIAGTAGRSYRYDAATNDPIGGTGFVIAVATVFDGDAVIRDKETKRAIGLNRKPRMTIEQLGLACAKVRYAMQVDGIADWLNQT